MQPLWRAIKQDGGYTFDVATGQERPFAFIAVRPCDIRAMAIQDRVFEGGAYKDTQYQARRIGAFIVAVNCAQAAPTCFCTSMGSGPKAGYNFDLALTETDPSGDHRFLVEIGTERGQRLLDGLSKEKATTADVEAADAVSSATAASR